MQWCQMQLRDATGKCKSWQPASGSPLLTWERELPLCIWAADLKIGICSNMQQRCQMRLRCQRSRCTAREKVQVILLRRLLTWPFTAVISYGFDFFFIGLSKRSNGFPVLNLFLDLQVILWLSSVDAFSLVRYRQRCSKQKGKLFQKLFHGKNLNFKANF